MKSRYHQRQSMDGSPLKKPKTGGENGSNGERPPLPPQPPLPRPPLPPWLAPLSLVNASKMMVSLKRMNDLKQGTDSQMT